MTCSDAFFINGTSATLISPCVSLFCTKKLKKDNPTDPKKLFVSSVLEMNSCAKGNYLSN